MGFTRTWSIVNGRQVVEVTGTPWVTPGDLDNHADDETNIHGIADTQDLLVTADLTAHAADTTSVHGIADTSALATEAYVDDAIAAHVAALHP